MTTYSAITTAEIDPDSPITTGLMTKLRDNMLAIQEGDASAPKILRQAVRIYTNNTSGAYTFNVPTGVTEVWYDIAGGGAGGGGADDTSTGSTAGANGGNTTLSNGTTTVTANGGTGGGASDSASSSVDAPEHGSGSLGTTSGIVISGGGGAGGAGGCDRLYRAQDGSNGGRCVGKITATSGGTLTGSIGAGGSKGNRGGGSGSNGANGITGFVILYY